MTSRLDPSFYEGVEIPQPEEENDPVILRAEIENLRAYMSHMLEQTQQEKHQCALKNNELNDKLKQIKQREARMKILETQNESLINDNRNLNKRISGLTASQEAIGVRMEELIKLNQKYEKYLRQQQTDELQKIDDFNIKWQDMGTQIDNNPGQLWEFDPIQNKMVKTTMAKPFMKKIMTKKDIDNLFWDLEQLTQIIVPSDKKRVAILQELKQKNEAEIQKLSQDYENAKKKILENDTIHQDNIKALTDAKDEKIKELETTIDNERVEKNILNQTITDLNNHVAEFQNEILEWKRCVERYENEYNPNHYWNERVNTYHDELKAIQMEVEKNLWFWQKWFIR
jgi:chromosome segregation ATPase